MTDSKLFAKNGIKQRKIVCRPVKQQNPGLLQIFPPSQGKSCWAAAKYHLVGFPSTICNNNKYINHEYNINAKNRMNQSINISDEL